MNGYNLLRDNIAGVYNPSMERMNSMLIYQRKNKKPERYLNGQYDKDMPAHLFFVGFLLPGDGQAKAAYKIIHYIALKGEGGKPRIPIAGRIPCRRPGAEWLFEVFL